MKAILTGLLWFDEHLIPPDVLQAYTYLHPFEDTVFKTYVLHNCKIGLPYGDIEKLHALIPNLNIIDKRVAPAVDKPFTSSIVLRPYQESVVDSITSYISAGGTSFNLAGAPGSGKTLTLATILANLGVKALIIANQSMLCDQILDEFRANTDADVGVLDSKHTELHDINIATSQFIAGNSEVWYKIKKGIGVVVLDEAHSLASPSTTRIIQRIYAKYTILISATFSRSTDKRTAALIDFAGHATFKLINSNLLVPNIIMVRCPEVYPPYSSKFQVAREKSKFFGQYSITEKILFLVTASLLKSRSVLIATDIITMQVDLAERLQDYGVGILNGKTSKKERVQILEDFDTGKLKVLIGAAVLNAGLSIPRISTIIRASFPSSPEKSVQLVGRALRDFDGKDGAFVFDLVFSGKSASKRIIAYKRNGYKVTNNTWERVEQHLSG